MPVTRRQATAPQRQPSHKETNLQDRNKSSATSQNTYNENLEGQRASSSSSQGVCQRDDNVREQEPKLPFVELVFYAVCIVGIMLRANVYAVYAKSQGMAILLRFMNACDTIKGNESHVGNVQFWVFNVIYLSI